jgi:FkbM family methyltransferase
MGLRNVIKEAVRPLGIYSHLRSLDVAIGALTRRVHDAEFRAIPALGKAPQIVDVGGNLGQSLVSFRALYPDAAIHSFEPNPLCASSLQRVRKLIGGEVTLHACGLGAAEGELPFFVPVLHDGTRLLQEGSFDATVFERGTTRERIGQPFTLATERLRVATLDSFGLSPALIKIDVQGLELEVLQGARDTLSRARPIVFVEREVENESSVATLLRELGYAAAPLSCNAIYQPATA